MHNDKLTKLQEVELPGSFPEAMVQVIDPHSWYLWGAFGCGFLGLSAWGNFGYDIIKNGFTMSGAVVLWMLLATALLILLAYILYKLDVKHRRRLAFKNITETGGWNQAKHYPGMITIVGDNLGPTVEAVKYHTDPEKVTLEERLKFCWCVMTRDQKVAEQFAQLQTQYAATGVEFIPCYIGDYRSILAVYDAVNYIYAKKIREKELHARDVVTEITPGTKPMSVGMALACLPHDRDIEYIENKRLADGTYEIKGVLNVDINFLGMP